MKKLINIRPALLIFIGMVLGILSAYCLYCGKFLLFALLLVVLCGLAVFTFIFGSRNIVTLVATILCACVGFALFYIQADYLTKFEYAGNVTLTGRVTDQGRNTYDDNYTIYLDECVIDDGENEYQLTGKVKTSYYFATEVEVGDVLTLKGTLRNIYFFRNGVDTVSLRNGVYYAFEYESFVDSYNSELTFDEVCRKYIFKAFTSNMDENSGIAYALVTGDRSAVSEDDNVAYRKAGIVHILAVSGLHVGFVVAVFSFVLDKFKVSPIAKLFILAVPLLFYCYICGFTPSVVRAVIMTIVACIVRCIHGERDMLSSLSIAGIIILLINPLYLFDAGFILSFSSVYGIATLSTAIERKTDNIEMPRLIRNVVNSSIVSLGATISTICITGSLYVEIPTLGILLNILVIPIITVVFVVTMFGLIPFASSVLLTVSNFLLSVISKLANFVSTLSFSSVEVPYLLVTAILVFILLFIAGGFVNLKGKSKKLTYVVASVLIAMTVVLSCIGTPLKDSVIVLHSYKGICCTATNNNGEALVVCNFSDEYMLQQAENSLQGKQVKNCIVAFTDYSSCKVKYLEEFCNEHNVTGAYLLSFDGNDKAEKYFNDNNIFVATIPKNEYLGDSIKLRSVYDGALAGYVVQSGDVSVAVAICKDVVLDKFYSRVEGVDALATFYDSAELLYNAKCPVLTRYQTKVADNYGANKFGNFTITKINDKIQLSFRGNYD